MSSADMQAVVLRLQYVMGVTVPCGQIIINMNDGRAQSTEARIISRVDKEPSPGAK